ncbi:hypothetical protein G9P44_004469 [Scheffersomyces stipitis]|nr:hypothetical protein G9P44_004469 [Scheffersomyces stipitis]
MHATVDRATVTAWAKQAQSTLEKAQTLCTNAQTSLHATSYQLTSHLPDLLEEANVLYESLKTQHELLAKISESLRRSTRDQLLNTLEKQQSTLLQPALNNLDDIVGHLSATIVPSFLIEVNGEDGKEIFEKDEAENRTLADFISTDSINLLRRNIQIYTNNHEKIRQLLNNKLQDVILSPFHEIGSKKFNKTVKLYEEITPLQLKLKAITSNIAPLDSSNVVATLLKENAALENELVSILEMLTNHYDQCTQGVQILYSGGSQQVNLEILKNDAQELPDVLKELHTVYDIIVNNEARAQKFINAHSPSIEVVIATMKDQLSFYRSFKSKNIPEIMVLFTVCEEILMKSPIEDPGGPEQTPIEKFTDTVNQLVYHYTQFLNVFKSQYLRELHHEQFSYPRKFLSKLTNFLNDELYKMQIEEKERRRAWLTKYGDFIPKEFRLPGEYNQPVITQVVTEGLEDVQKEGADAERHITQEKELLELLRKMEELNRERRY